VTPAQAERAFARLRAAVAARYPAAQDVTLRLHKRHFLRSPKARDLAWYDPTDRTVNLLHSALRGPAGRVEGLIAHELGHAADPVPEANYAERRADAMAKKALGVPVRYDKDDVQNLRQGRTPRPARLPENRPRGAAMKRNPTSPKTARKPDPWLVRIATEVLQFPTLETRGRDSLDFKEVAVWNVKQALDGAYRRGFVKGGGMLSGPSIHTFTDPVAVAAIAKKFFNFPTLETHRVGDLDFKEVAVWNVMPALEDAHRAGFAAARGKKRNPTAAYHRTRGDAKLVLAEDSLRTAKVLRRKGDASGSHDALIHAHRMAALAESDLLDGSSPKAAKAKQLAWWKAYSALAADKKRNPSKAAKLASLDRRIKAAEEAGIPPHYLMEQRDLLAKKAKRNPAGKASPLKGTRLPEAHARHVAEGLLGRMHADGADTFAKKVKWVKKHMPQIDRPRTFVGWVTKGERGRVVRNPTSGYEAKLKEAGDNRAKLYRSLAGKTKEQLLAMLGTYYRLHSMSTKSSKTDLKYAITSAAYPDPRPPRSR
jgi:hypothetical protein